MNPFFCCVSCACSTALLASCAATVAALFCAVEGWAETSEQTVIDLARRFEDAGVAAIIYTDIERDGVLKGLNLAATAELARSTRIPVIASGGLASIEDVKALLRPEHAMLEGAITGRALYDGRIDPAVALALLAGGRGTP